MVLKYLHHSTDLENIRQDLLEQGHVARNIVNARHKITKEPLNLFFIDLEPATNNKAIYKITAIQNKIIHFEPPRTNKNQILQCTRCQDYGHKRSYCNRPFACVKCGGQHSSATCPKSKDTPAKCALCGGNHPANYKGCESYHNTIRSNNPYRIPQARQHTQSMQPITQNPYIPAPPQQPQQSRTYADVTSNRSKVTDDPITSLTKFLENSNAYFPNSYSKII